MGSALIGSLFGAFVITEVNATVFYLVMTTLCILASMFFLLLRPPNKVSEWKETEHVSLKDVWNLLLTPKMLTVCPLMMTSGLCIAGNAGILVPLLEMTMTDDWSAELKSKKALIALSILGLGEILGAIGFGKLIDKLGYKVSGYLCLGSYIVSIIFICAYIR